MRETQLHDAAARTADVAGPLSGPMTSSEELPAGTARAFAIFTGDVESDPDRVGFWVVEVTAHGLTLQRAEVPVGQEERESVSWAELHEVLGARAALVEDLEHLRYERRQETESLVRLRVEGRRLRTLVEGRKRLLGGEAPHEGPGIVPLRRAATAAEEGS